MDSYKMTSRSNDEPHMVITNTAEALEDYLSDIPPADPGKPRVLFKSDLVLTRAQEDKLCEYLKKTYERLDDQLGRSDTATDGQSLPSFIAAHQADNGLRQERKFMAKRLLYQMIGESDMSWRPAMLGGIFAVSNLVVPLARRIASQMGARAVNYFFGTDPWLAQYPVGGEEDRELALRLQRLTEVKFQDSGSLAVLRRAVATAPFTIGEAVLKTTQTSRREFYRKQAIVAVGPDGKPLLAVDGLPIRQEDTWTMLEDGTTVLDRDQQTPKPPVLNFANVLLDEEVVFYEGPEVSQIYYRDFLCPENARDVQSAECVIHMMERSASQLAQAYMQSPGKSLEDVQAAVGAIRNSLHGSNESKSGERSARLELGEQTTVDFDEPITEYGEFYCRYDADGDFVQEDIMVVMDPKTGYPIYYNYTANVTDDGKRPFQVIRARPVMNRWYGQGAIEQFERHQETVDLMVNRRNLSQSQAGRVTLWNPANTMEGDADPELKLNWGRTYTLKPGKKVEETLGVVYLDDNKYDRLTEELEFFMQLAMNESGVQHANDGAAAGSDTTKLATGIKNIEKSGQELFGVCISELDVGITEVAQSFTTTLYANLNDEETFLMFEGDVPREMTVAGRDVKNLRFNVQTLLTRYKDEQTLASKSQAYGLLYGEVPYYSLPLGHQIGARSFVRDILTALQIKNADSYLMPMAMPMMAAPTGGPPSGVPQDPKQGQPNL